MARLAPCLLLALSCAAPPAGPEEPAPAPIPAARPPERPGPVVRRAGAALRRGDVAAARALLEEERWLAEDRARAALLLFGCYLLEGRHADGVDALRAYLEKTPRVRTHRDAIAARLLRHHASGGGLRARSAEEAAYFGLYASRALNEAETARADLEWAAREAPLPERLLVAIVRM